MDIGFNLLTLAKLGAVCPSVYSHGNQWQRFLYSNRWTVGELGWAKQQDREPLCKWEMVGSNKNTNEDKQPPRTR